MDAAAFGYDTDDDFLDTVSLPALDITRFLGAYDPALDGLMVGTCAIQSRGGTRCSSALTVVTTSAVPGPSARASAANVASLVLSMSGLGETRSYGRQPQAGKDKIATEGAMHFAAPINAPARPPSDRPRQPSL